MSKTLPRFSYSPSRLAAVTLVLCSLLGADGASAAVRRGNEQAARYFEDANGRFARNDVAGAIIQARNAVQKEPDLLAAHLLLAKALLKDGQAAAAEVEFERTLELGVSLTEIAEPYGTALMLFGKSDRLLERIKPDGLPAPLRAEVLAMRATAYADLGDMKAAFRSVEAGRLADPKSLAPLRAEIDLSLRSRNSTRARQALDTALGMAPGDPQLLHLRGALLQSAGDADGAMTYFNRALKAEPRLLDALIARASLLIDLKRPEEAMPDLERAAALSEREPRVAYLKSLVYASRGDTKASRVQLEEVTRLVDMLPEDFIARQPPLLMLGSLAAHALGRPERARALLELYVQRMPGDPAGRKLLANIYLANGESARVADLLEPLLRSGDADSQVLTTLAAVKMLQGRYREASVALEAAVRATGDNPGVLAQHGFALIASQQSDLGLATLRRAFDKEAGQPNVASALCTLYLRRGDTRNALQVAEALLGRLPNEGLAHNLMGVVRAASGQPAEARAAFAKAIALKPGLMPAQLNLARLEASEGQLDAARQRLQSLLKQAPRDVQALTELARVDAMAGRLVEASAGLEKARALAPGDVPAGLELLAVYRRMGKPAAALTVAKQLVIERPDAPAVVDALGRAHLAVGDLSSARAAFAVLARLAGADAERLVQVGRLQLEAGGGGDAAASAEKALAARPGYMPAQVLQIDGELVAANLTRADSLLRTLMLRNGSDPEVLRLAGDLAMARRMPADAVQHYQAGFGKAPSRLLALRILAASFQAGNGERGVAVLESWLRSHPDDLQARTALAEGHFRLNRLSAARVAYEAVLAQAPQNGGVANNLAQVLLRQNDPGAAAMAERAVRLAPQDANALDTLGWVRVRGGALEAGLKILREARLRAPASRDIRFHLAWALSRSGKQEEARSELRAALGGQGDFESVQEAQTLRRELGV